MGQYYKMKREALKKIVFHKRQELTAMYAAISVYFFKVIRHLVLFLEKIGQPTFRFRLIFVWMVWMGQLNSITAQTTIQVPLTYDMHLSTQTAGTNALGSCTSMKILNDGTDDVNSLYLFDVSGIPVGATITNATLSVFKSAGTTTEVSGLYRMTRDWTYTSTCGSAGFPSYIQSESGVNWTIPGGDFDPTAISTMTTTSANQYYNWDATALVQDWVNGTQSNFGMILDHVSGSGTQITLNSSETGSNPPILEIVYTTIELSTVVTNESCSGNTDGMIDLTVTNGTAPITYAWSDGAITTEDRSGLATGNYTVTVTAANGTISTTATVNGPKSMSLSTSVTDLSTIGAIDGAIDLTVMDGTAPFTYVWSNGATTEDISSLGADTYTVTVTDACTSTAMTSVILKSLAQKYLYLTSTNSLDRIDPVATTDNTTSSTTNLEATETAAVADNFDTDGVYTGTNSTGSLDWATDWIETDPGGGGAVSGGVQVSGNALNIYDSTTGADASREIDLSSATAASLLFNFTNAMNHAGDNVTIELSKDGGATYPHIIAVFDRNTVNGLKTFTDFVVAFGALTVNTRIRFRVSGNGGAGNNYSSYDNITISYTKPGAATETFTQGVAMCSDFTIKGGEPIIITAYTTITSGTMPANPTIDAVLSYVATNITTLSNPTYTSGTGLLTWTGTLGSDMTIPAGQAAALTISSSETAAIFTVDYDSQAKPSKIQLPTSATYINVDSYALYDAAYPGVSLITSTDAGTTVYMRAVVSDPFGFEDITGMDIKITDAYGAISNVSGTSVATSGCTRTYEYVWNTTGSASGNASIDFTANEGTEGVTHTEITTFEIISPVVITKELVTPSTAPYTVGQTFSYGYPSNVVNKLKAKESKNYQNCDKNDNFGQKIKYVKTSMERNNHPSAN